MATPVAQSLAFSNSAALSLVWDRKPQSLQTAQTLRYLYLSGLRHRHRQKERVEEC